MRTIDSVSQYFQYVFINIYPFRIKLFNLKVTRKIYRIFRHLWLTKSQIQVCQLFNLTLLSKLMKISYSNLSLLSLVFIRVNPDIHNW